MKKLKENNVVEYIVYGFLFFSIALDLFSIYLKMIGGISINLASFVLTENLISIFIFIVFVVSRLKTKPKGELKICLSILALIIPYLILVTFLGA